MAVFSSGALHCSAFLHYFINTLHLYFFFNLRSSLIDLFLLSSQSHLVSVLRKGSPQKT